MKIRGLKRKALALSLTIVSAIMLLFILDSAFPPDFTRYETLAHEVVDENGETLRIFLSADGFHRLSTSVNDVDPDYLKLLIAYEDRRFYEHSGVDAKAVVRAALQALSNGRIISGASTLTMQTARLLEPRRRNAFSKFIEMLRAWQLERRLSKEEILNIYLSLAPYGGNREGVRAATHAYFGHDAKDLSLAEAALLVALPQSPTRLRPDSNPTGAAQARAKILRIAGPRIGATQKDLEIAATAPVKVRLQSLPQFATHASEWALSKTTSNRTQTHLNKNLQRLAEGLVRQHAQDIGPNQSVAVLIVENKSRKVKAYIGSPDFSDSERLGAIDMVHATRSPGSALKPFIYGLAMERGLIDPKTRIWDGPTRFGTYTPTNFEDEYHGQLSISDALRKSLNVPAVAVLNKLGPVWTAETLKAHGLYLNFGGKDVRPGLAFALGGVGTTLWDLASFYAALGDDGSVRPLRLIKGDEYTSPDTPLFKDRTRRALKHILEGSYVPQGFARRGRVEHHAGIAFKTGTSYGFRDAWAIGYSDTHSVAIWVGRADGTPSPGQFGIRTAAPLLFRIFELLPEASPISYRPRWASFEVLPPALRYFDKEKAQEALQIAQPLDGSVQWLSPHAPGIELRVNGGVPPYEWLINGQLLVKDERWRQTLWKPDGPGFSKIVVVDAKGQRAQARLKVSMSADGPDLVH